MPYKSDKQRAWMHIHEPAIAARWDKEYGGKPMPDARSKIKNAMKNVGPGKGRSPGGPRSPFNLPGRRVGRNMTPGVPRRVGSNSKGPLQNSNPPYIQRDPLNDYQGHNLPPKKNVAPGEPDPNSGPPIIPGVEPEPRPRNQPVKGRLNTLTDKNKKNNRKAMKPLLRMYTRALQGKQFGGYVFGENKGNTTSDFLKTIKPYTKGTGLYKMFNQQINPPPKRGGDDTPTSNPPPEPEGAKLSARIAKARQRAMAKKVRS